MRPCITCKKAKGCQMRPILHNMKETNIICAEYEDEHPYNKAENMAMAALAISIACFIFTMSMIVHHIWHYTTR